MLNYSLFYKLLIVKKEPLDVLFLKNVKTFLRCKNILSSTVLYLYFVKLFPALVMVICKKQQ